MNSPLILVGTERAFEAPLPPVLTKMLNNFKTVQAMSTKTLRHFLKIISGTFKTRRDLFVNILVNIGTKFIVKAKIWQKALKPN